MPTILRVGPYRLYFFSNESGEPPHVHIDRDDQTCKFWLTPVVLAGNIGFGAKELRQIEKIVTDNETKCLEAWHEYFRN